MSEVARNEIFEIEPTGTGRSRITVPWWLLAAIALAVAEWSAHPALGVVIFCLKFGFNDWRTAAWLCRTDTDRERARTIWWFLLGSGFLKIFLISAIAYPFLLIFLRLVFLKPVDGLELGVSMLVGLCGIGFSLVVTHVGALLAARRGVKVWINRQLHGCRDHGLWPPRLGSPNHIKTIIDGSSLPALLGFLIGLLFMLVGLAQRVLPAMATGSLIFAVSTIILLSHAVLLKRIIALTPDECWGERQRLAQITKISATETWELVEDDDSDG